MTATAGAVAAVGLCALLSSAVQREVLQGQGEELIRGQMRVAVLEAESARHATAQLNQRGAFDMARLAAEAKAAPDFRATTLYQTVPVVAAWTAMRGMARQEKFEFRVVREQPRNPENAPDERERRILSELADGKPDFFEVDGGTDRIVYARPIRLTADCLSCHGDPGRSATGDGKDVLGFRMEGWREGELRGAFILKAEKERIDGVVRKAMGTTLAWALGLVLLFAPGFWVLNRALIVRPLVSLSGTLQESGQTTAETSRRISAAGESLAAAATEQAASLEETSATLEEVSSTARSNAASAASAKEFADQARGTAEAGVEEMHRMLAAMNGIEEAGRSVSRILQTVEEIALQTNLLALNAAVEASRAGTAGAGFAVVAGEVRSLAQRSTAAAKETGELIGQSLQRTAAGARLSQSLGKRLEEIAGRCRQVQESVAQIAAASDEQRTGVQQVNIAVSQMSEVTQQMAGNAEQSSGAAQVLSRQTEDLQEIVGSLASLVGAGARRRG